MKGIGKGLGKQLVMAFLCTVFILCLSITLTVLCRWIYYFDIEFLNIPESSGYSAEVCRANYDILIDYNLLISPDELCFTDFIMSYDGCVHFAEVKRIFLAAQWISIIGMICFVGRILWQRRRKIRDFRWLRLTGGVSLGIVAVAGAAVAIDWESTFVIMHKILFNNDFWLFDPKTDPIIKILPDQFFMHCGIAIMILAVIFVIGCQALHRIFNDATQK